MAREKKTYEFFNHELKERFFEQYTENTKKTYRAMFDKIKELEMQLNKDLCQFNSDELEALFYLLAPKTPRVANTYLSIVKKYIDFCIAEGYTNSNINFATLLQSKDVEKFISKYSLQKDYLTSEQEYRDAVFACLNAQDSAILVLAWNGIKGHELMEMRGITTKDLNKFENYVTIKRDNKNFVINLTPWEFEVLEDAMFERNYTLPETHKAGIKYLEDTEYLLKPVRNRNRRDKMISVQTINQRMDRIGEFLGKPYLSTQNVWVSGLMNRLIKESIKEKVFEQFNIKDESQKYYYGVTFFEKWLENVAKDKEIALAK